MRCVILGGQGQLGCQFAALLGEQWAFSRTDLDVTRCREKLLHMSPRLVINCAAYNAVDQAEENWQTAFAVNSWALAELARTCAELDAVLVHFSTDYVFGGDAERRHPYRETDDPAPVNLYGVSKWAGERVIRSLWGKHIVVRTCGLYGPRTGLGGKPNFVATMLRLAGEDQPVRVVNDQVCTPTSTVDLAAAVLTLVESRAFGLFHLTNEESCSWYEFARAIFEIQGLKVDLSPCTSAEFPRKAKRPCYSALRNDAYNALGLRPLRPWREALQESLCP